MKHLFLINAIPAFQIQFEGSSPYSINICKTVRLLESMDSYWSAQQNCAAEHMPLIYYVLNLIPVQIKRLTKLVPGAAYGIISLTTRQHQNPGVKGAAKLCKSNMLTSSLP